MQKYAQPSPTARFFNLMLHGVAFYLKIRIITTQIISSPCFWKTNHVRAIKFRIEVFKCLIIFIHALNIYVQNREAVFTKTFKTFTNFVWIEIFYVKRRNIIIKVNIWIVFRIKKLSFTVKWLYDIHSMFASGAILVFHGISFSKKYLKTLAKQYPVLSFS